MEYSIYDEVYTNFDLIYQIFLYLNYEELQTIFLTYNKTFNKILNERLFWKDKIIIDYPIIDINDIKEYKIYYMHLSKLSNLMNYYKNVSISMNIGLNERKGIKTVTQTPGYNYTTEMYKDKIVYYVTADISKVYNSLKFMLNHYGYNIDILKLSIGENNKLYYNVNATNI